MNMRKKEKKENITVHISCPNNIGPAEMEKIIAQAIIKADEMRVQKEEEKRKEIDKKFLQYFIYC